MFSTYALMPVGLTFAVVVVTTVTVLGWVVARHKQQRMERLVDAMEQGA